MKGFFSLIILITCIFMFIPLIILIFEHICSGRDSILQKLLNNINP